MKGDQMRLIFIRHGDPDYVNDSLTEKGKREAELLAKRVATWDNITHYYASPLGRAQLTAKYSLDPLGITPTTLDWLQEFPVRIYHPGDNTRMRVAWDLLPDYWRKHPEYFDKDKWVNADLYRESGVKEEYDHITGEFTKLLAEYGIHEKENVYYTDKPGDDSTLVFFCHLGVSFVLISKLLGMSPTFMWHTFFVATTSVTIVGAEELTPGILNFRIQSLGDTRHLNDGGEPTSRSGYFQDIFQG